MINYRKIKGLIKLIRPELPMAAGICVIIGEIIALGRFPSSLKLFLGFAWGFFLSSPAMIMNDYFDIEVDKVNSPHRPLPSGLVSSAEAVNLAIFTTLIGLAASTFISRSAILLYIIFWFVGFVYNWKLKEMGLLGNLLVSCSVSITFILGGIAVGKPWNEAVWTFSIIVFLFDLGEEIASDVMDIEGDRKRNVKSLAVLIGKKKALGISASLFMLVIILSFRPVLLNLLGISYLLIITITDFMILIFEIRLLRCETVKEGRIYIRAVYLSAILGLLSIIISKII